jgi:hypothetical protein
MGWVTRTRTKKKKSKIIIKFGKQDSINIGQSRIDLIREATD